MRPQWLTDPQEQTPLFPLEKLESGDKLEAYDEKAAELVHRNIFCAIMVFVNRYDREKYPKI